MIIDSLLDTDLYKFTMMQVVLHHFPGAQVEYRFRCRNEGIDLRPYVGAIRDEVRHLCSLRFRDDELDYLRSMRFIKSDFVDFLGLFHMNEKYISIGPSPKDNGEIDITIRGPWLHTILFEVPVLSIVNELYFRATVDRPDYAEGRRRLAAKIDSIVGQPDLAASASPTTARAGASRASGTRRCCSNVASGSVRASPARRTCISR